MNSPTLEIISDNDNELVASLTAQEEEAPFAVVGGERLTELPKDLYIPPGALQVFLEAFSGPLDLLLYLIRKQNLDILDIPIADITRQYTQYIELMQELELELAGEYLLMAAMLAEIKSRMLLPRPAAATGEEEEDPRAELVRRLQEYERFKKAAEDLDALPRMERDALPANAELVERKVLRREPDVTMKEMLRAIKAVLKRADMFAHHHIQREPLSVRQRMTDILTTLQGDAFVPFVTLFRPEEGRMGVTVTFMAVLELMREALVEIVQAEPYAPLHVRPKKTAAGSGAAAASDVADAENQAALAQPALEGEDEVESLDDWSETPEPPVESDQQDEPQSSPSEADAIEVESVAAEPIDAVQLDAEPIEVDSTDGESIEPEPVIVGYVDVGQAEAELIEADSTDGERIDAEPVAAEPIDAVPLDAETTEVGSTDGESIEPEPVIVGYVDVEQAEAELIEADSIDGERIDAESVAAEPIDAVQLGAETTEVGSTDGESIEPAPVIVGYVDVGQAEAELIEADSIDGERIDAEPVAAEHVDVMQLDAEPIESGSADGEPIDAEPVAIEHADVRQVEAESIEESSVDGEPSDVEPADADRLASDRAEPGMTPTNESLDPVDADDVADSKSVESSTEIR